MEAIKDIVFVQIEQSDRIHYGVAMYNISSDKWSSLYSNDSNLFFLVAEGEWFSRVCC